jgi:hypothetical protein
MTMPQVKQPEQFPVGFRPTAVDSTIGGPSDNYRRPLAVAECCLCGIARPLGLLVPDGGGACADIRWYCKDVKACTERWTAGISPTPAYQPQEVQAFTQLRPRSQVSR